ncbi:hypothetical protein C7413_12683 [Paraburkholderia silvatlantica]|nr:hypothetical protein C7411_12783 [Paraburkholderia silvatlantica]PXW31190.1 hypothetical protein C7413_12683 [Paraburkholderia silvatlantica]
MLSYSLAAVQSRNADDGSLDEDVELVAALLFLAGALESGRINAGDQVVAEIRIPILSKLRAKRKRFMVRTPLPVPSMERIRDRGALCFWTCTNAC